MVSLRSSLNSPRFFMAENSIDGPAQNADAEISPIIVSCLLTLIPCPKICLAKIHL